MGDAMTRANITTLALFATAGVVFCSSIALAQPAAGPRRPPPSQAPSAEAHRQWMDEAGDLQEDLRAAFEEKSGANVAGAATKLEQLMAKTQAYWAGKHATDIVAIAKESRAFAKQMATAGKAGKLDEAGQAFAKLNTRCNSCHDLHPEKR